MTDKTLVERLRRSARNCAAGTSFSHENALDWKAADRIEELEGLVKDNATMRDDVIRKLESRVEELERSEALLEEEKTDGN